MNKGATVGPLKAGTLKAVGSLAMISAIMTPVVFVVSLQMVGRHDQEATVVSLALQIGGTVVFLLLTGMMRLFLRRNCVYAGTDKVLLLLMVLNSIYALVTSQIIVEPGLEERLRPALAALLVALGVTQAYFGYRLRGAQHGLGDLKNPYCKINIVTGLMLASLVLLPIGIMASAVSDVMLATILLQAAARQKNHE